MLIWFAYKRERNYSKYSKNFHIITDRFSFISLDRIESRQEGDNYPSHEAINICRRYKEYIAMLAEMSFKILWTSNTWSRIFLLEDETEPNEEGVEIDYSEKELETLR